MRLQFAAARPQRPPILIDTAARVAGAALPVLAAADVPSSTGKLAGWPRCVAAFNTSRLLSKSVGLSQAEPLRGQPPVAENTVSMTTNRRHQPIAGTSCTGWAFSRTLTQLHRLGLQSNAHPAVQAGPSIERSPSCTGWAFNRTLAQLHRLGLQSYAHPAAQAGPSIERSPTCTGWAFNRTLTQLRRLGLQLHAHPAAQAGPSIERSPSCTGWAFNRTLTLLHSLGLQSYADPAAQPGPSVVR